jgi:ABC-2 type transport system ATP-binding protein
MLFLDEPTTGLDPQARLEIRDLIEELRAEKRTILMTTHYIEEAERLCDRVAIIDAGKIIAIGSPRELQAQSANQSAIEMTLTQAWRGETLPTWPETIMSHLGDDGRHIKVTSTRPARTLVEMVKWVDREGIELDDVRLTRPTLEDVFIELTGKKLRD